MIILLLFYLLKNELPFMRNKNEEKGSKEVMEFTAETNN